MKQQTKKFMVPLPKTELVTKQAIEAYKKLEDGSYIVVRIDKMPRVPKSDIIKCEVVEPFTNTSFVVGQTIFTNWNDLYLHIECVLMVGTGIFDKITGTIHIRKQVVYNKRNHQKIAKWTKQRFKKERVPYRVRKFWVPIDPVIPEFDGVRYENTSQK